MTTDRSTSGPTPIADGRRWALLGVGSAVTSLFLAPPLFGFAGALLGMSAVRRGSRTLGWLAVGLSLSLAAFSSWLALQLVHRL